jgi:energy coupling factor transporter S component ThiW
MTMKSFRLTLSAFFVALGTLTAGLFYIPVGISKCFPMQSLINCLAGVLIGPNGAAIAAFLIALLRNLLGTGSLLAFPGSIVGAYLSGWFFIRTKKESASLLGEIVGTGLIAALIASFMSTYLLGKTVPFYFFIIPFGMSALGGALLAGLIMKSPLMAVVKKRLEK